MIRRFLTRILIVALIAVCGYNGWQVQQLQGQVARLQAQVQETRGQNAGPAAREATPIDRSWLGQADRHVALARAAALRADLPTAQRELQRGIDDMHKAVREPEQQTQATLGRARHTLASLQSQADDLWRKVHAAAPSHNPERDVMGHHHSSKLRRAAPLAACAALALLAGAGCQNGRIGNDVDTTQENDLGKQAAQQIDAQAKFVTDGKYNRRINAIAQPIFAQAIKDRPDVSFRVRVIDSPEVNAFSIPGGYVYVYRGLLDKLGTDDDAIACIIGHESAHVVRRHVVKQMSDSQGKGILVDLASLLSRSYAVNQLGGMLYELDQLHFSRADEYEADRWGEKFAYNAGYDPSGMVRTFQVLQRMEKLEGTPPPYAQDHPINENRTLRALEQYRELRANGGKYLEDTYAVDGDKLAAKRNDISYPALVLATTAPKPAQPVVTPSPEPKQFSVRADTPPDPNSVLPNAAPAPVAGPPAP